MKKYKTVPEKLLHTYPTFQAMIEKLDQLLSPAIRGAEKATLIEQTLKHTGLSTKLKIMRLITPDLQSLLHLDEEDSETLDVYLDRVEDSPEEKELGKIREAWQSGSDTTVGLLTEFILERSAHPSSSQIAEMVLALPGDDLKLIMQSLSLLKTRIT